uniref:Regulatory protein FmdB Zinc ribbon domain-containing protein n=1 Tax=Salmonella phage Manna TaxID=3234042 RepID=A0AB39C9T6_9CAUD
MPMYDYKCQSKDCAKEYEKIKKISERENDVCLNAIVCLLVGLLLLSM